MNTLGRVAYEAYCADTGGVSLVSGAKLPGWHKLDDAIRHAWEHAANEIVEECCCWLESRCAEV